jgi:hypothetical protein
MPKSKGRLRTGCLMCGASTGRSATKVGLRPGLLRHQSPRGASALRLGAAVAAICGLVGATTGCGRDQAAPPPALTVRAINCSALLLKLHPGLRRVKGEYRAPGSGFVAANIPRDILVVSEPLIPGARSSRHGFPRDSIAYYGTVPFPDFGYYKTAVAEFSVPVPASQVVRWYGVALAACGYYPLSKPLGQGSRLRELVYGTSSLPILANAVVIWRLSSSKSLVVYMPIATDRPRRPSWSYVPSHPSLVQIADIPGGTTGFGHRLTIRAGPLASSIAALINSPATTMRGRRCLIGTRFKPTVMPMDVAWMVSRGSTWQVRITGSFCGWSVSVEAPHRRDVVLACDAIACGRSAQLLRGTLQGIIAEACARTRCPRVKLATWQGLIPGVGPPE